MTPLPRPALSPCRSQMHPLQGLQRGLTMLTVLACFLGGGMTSTPVWAQSGSKAGNTEFPRLGMWWPDPESQPLREIARYDYVMLFDDQSKFIQPLKAINPNLILLNSTNACEVTYEWPEDDLSKYPAEWFLTQVGSTLTQDVDAATTTFHVVGLSVTEGDNTHSLFIPGDTVLIEGESVLIRSVDAAKRTLTVDRGHVRPASSHKAGTRIAAHVTFWPGSWLMNLSHLAAKGTLDPSIGPERWGDYHARQDAKLISLTGWDGLTIDRADPNQSWLVGGSTARTLDPDQSNRLITDYTSFDASWNQGLRDYESQLRQAIGDEKILYVNWGMDNYDLLNGNNYEGFPLDDGTSYQGDWRQTVLGPLTDVGGYLPWMKKGRRPNLTTIQTYEDDSSPPPDDIHYHNPFDQPGFVPNYRKMRLGLGTALLGDGYFSYEINTNGHGTLGLMWFDEYDNAGKQRGYLGQPLADAFRVDGIQLGENLVRGGNFQSRQDRDHWELSMEDECEARWSLATHQGSSAIPMSSAKIDVTQASDEGWKVSFSFPGLPLTANTLHTLRFRAKSDKKRMMPVWAQQNVDPWENFFEIPDVSLDTDWQDFEVTVTPDAISSDATSPDAILHFGLGKTTGTVWIDSVSLRSGGHEVWRRDFSRGTVIVNATNQSRDINLGSTFRKLKGRQAPSVNDGTLVERITVPARDSRILLRAGS